MKRLRILKLACLAAVMTTMFSCRIEPPLNLPTENVVVELPIVIQELQIVWDIDISWTAKWVYEWDEEDSLNWGSLRYPEPKSFDVRRYFIGEYPNAPHTWEGRDWFIIYEPRFKRRFNFGYHDILVWTRIESEDGTQVLVINEDDIENVIGTTTTRSVRMYTPKMAAASQVKMYNQPEIFYSAFEKNVHITNNIEDYDYYDEVENVWVKKLDATLNPLVYIYLVQVILHNNKGRIVKASDLCAIDGLAKSTSVNFGNTSEEDVSVLFPMRLKKDKSPKEWAKPGETLVDVLGGKLTTFGLCGMPPWSLSRAAAYSGTRSDLKNNFALNLQFHNETDSTYYYDVTKQFQTQSHGGLITIEIDVDTLKIPVNPTPPGGGGIFDPRVEDYDDIVYPFDM